jgi:hypothetical protein
VATCARPARHGRPAGGFLRATADDAGATVTLNHSGTTTYLQGQAFDDSQITRILTSAGDGDKAVNLVATNRPVSLNAGGGTSYLHLGGGPGGLLAIRAQVDISYAPGPGAPPPCGFIDADDGPCTAPRTYSLYYIGSTGYIYKNGTLLWIYYPVAGTCEVDFVSGNNPLDVVNVYNTPVPTRLDAWAPNKVRLGNPGETDYPGVGVRDFQGPVSVLNTYHAEVGHSSTSELTVTDETDGAGQAAELSDGRIDGLAPTPITYTASSLRSLAGTTGSGDDTVSVTGTSPNVPLTLANSGGRDKLVGKTPGAQDWSLTDPDSGKLSPSAGAELSFHAFQDLTGGPGDDSFHFDDGATVTGTIDGGGGSNTLDYTPSNTSVPVDLNPAALQATGVGAIARIQNAIGGRSGPASGPGAPWNILVGNGGNLLAGGQFRRNLLIAGASPSALAGGGDDDVLVGATTAWDADTTGLKLIMQEWTQGPDDYYARADHIMNGGGLNGPYLLNPTTVSNNGDTNYLSGHFAGGVADQNLYYGSAANMDPFMIYCDKQPGEIYVVV